MDGLFGALEAGGTKMICAICDKTGRILDRNRIPTGSPKETIYSIIEYFRGKDIQALGIACFGPVDPRKSSPEWGHILKTPKQGWAYHRSAGY